MADYYVVPLNPLNNKVQMAVDRLLISEGIRRDANLDYTCGIFDNDATIIATGSCFANTLRCLAVSKEHQGEGLMNTIVTHLIAELCNRQAQDCSRSNRHSISELHNAIEKILS